MIEVNGKPYKYDKFPDGTLRMRYAVDPDTDAVQYRVNWRFKDISEEVVLRNLVWHIQDKNPTSVITLALDYVPNARMDRTQNQDEVFTLKYFTKAINELCFHKVYILDPHSNVTPALLNHVHVDMERLIKYITQVIDKVKPDYLFFPDEGAAKRLGGLLRHPYICGWKKRDWDTGQIQGTQVLGLDDLSMISGRRILICDDISSYGGTFLHQGRKLHEYQAAELFLYITHCENSILDGELIKSGLMARIFTAPTIFTGAHELIEVLED